MPPKKKKQKLESTPQQSTSGKRREKKEEVPLGKKREKKEEEVALVFRSLPREVVEVASRIGLRTNVSRDEIDALVASSVGNTSADISVLSYSCKKTHERMIEYSRVKREKHRFKKKRVKLSSKERKKLFSVGRESGTRVDRESGTRVDKDSGTRVDKDSGTRVDKDSGSTVNKDSGFRYDTFREVNEVWKGYMTKLSGEITSDHDQLRLLRADYHGADLDVFSSKNPALVGLRGIVVQETKLTFKVIDESNRISVIPKVGTIFSFQLNGNLYKLNGSSINFNPHHRSRIKVKCRKFTEEF